MCSMFTDLDRCVAISVGSWWPLEGLNIWLQSRLKTIAAKKTKPGYARLGLLEVYSSKLGF